MKCRTTNKNITCNEVKNPEPVTVSCKPLEVCIGFGRQLVYDGNCFRLDNPETLITDGWYSEFQVIDGCIVEARQAALPIYTPPPCAPVPEPCDGGGSGDGITIAPDTCNLSRWNSSGQLLTTLSVQPGSGVTLSGCGSINDPLIVSLDQGGDASVYITSLSPSWLTVSGSGSSIDPYILQMVSSPLGAGTYAGFEIDDFGRITGYTTPEASGVIGIVGGPGIEADNQAGLVTISLGTSGVTAGTYTLGGYNVTIASTGQVTNVVRQINTVSGVYTFGDYEVAVNEFGSITEITALTTLPTMSYSKLFTGTRSEMSAIFETTVPGKFRISYKGNLGTYSGTVTEGLMPYTGLITLLINGSPQAIYCVVSGTTIVELVVLTASAYTAGTQEFELTVPTAVTSPGMLNIDVVSEAS